MCGAVTPEASCSYIYPWLVCCCCFFVQRRLGVSGGRGRYPFRDASHQDGNGAQLPQDSCWGYRWDRRPGKDLGAVRRWGTAAATYTSLHVHEGCSSPFIHRVTVVSFMFVLCVVVMIAVRIFLISLFVFFVFSLFRFFRFLFLLVLASLSFLSFLFFIFLFFSCSLHSGIL